MNRIRWSSLALGIALALLGTSCASTAAHSERAQPFHVAVIPITGSVRLENPQDSTDGEITLVIDETQLTNAVCAAMGDGCFARASLLEPPADVSPEEFDAWDVARRDAHWLEQARSIGADLVLECDLAFAGEVVGESNEKFWLNLPLFLLGGPGCYFIGDCTFRGDARLLASLYELHALVDQRATLGDGRSRLVQVEARFQEIALDFIDRADAHPGHYAVSLVVPAGLLARSGDGVERSLTETVSRDLAAGIARELSLQQRRISDADRVAPFRLDPRVEIVAENGDVTVRGSVLLNSGDVDRMESFVVRSGSAVVNGEFDEGIVDEDLSTRRERVLRYSFEAGFPRVDAGSFVSVEIAAGGRSRIVRSFTLPLDVQANSAETSIADAGSPR